jgi:hypothetical protein
MNFINQCSVCILARVGVIYAPLIGQNNQLRGANHQLQAAAAVGQMGLVQTYESLFAQQNIHTAQVLLTIHMNFINQCSVCILARVGVIYAPLIGQNNQLRGANNVKQSNNVSATLDALLALGTVPIVNENDTVATDENLVNVLLPMKVSCECSFTYERT